MASQKVLNPLLKALLANGPGVDEKDVSIDSGEVKWGHEVQIGPGEGPQQALDNRIKIFTSLPLASLDRIKLQERLAAIGKTPFGPT